MVILIIDQDCITVLKGKRQPPVSVYNYRPVIGKVAGKQV